MQTSSEGFWMPASLMGCVDLLCSAYNQAEIGRQAGSGARHLRCLAAVAGCLLSARLQLLWRRRLVQPAAAPPEASAWGWRALAPAPGRSAHPVTKWCDT